MRELSDLEIQLVSGGKVCTPENSIGGVSDFNGLGQDLINFYEGVVMFASHVIERVANAF